MRPRTRGACRWLLAVSLVLALAGCGQKVLVQKATEQTVANAVASHTGFRPTDVSCPSGLPAKVGEMFDCHFTGPDGHYTAHMVVKSVQGSRVLYSIVSRRTS